MIQLIRPQTAARVALALGAALLGSSTVALAQGTPASTADASLALEEVVVTARKREENLQDVPISITAFSANTIEDRGIESVYDIARLTPNLSFNQSYGRTFDRPVIRGMSQVLGERTVSFVVDGVYIAGNITGADLDDLEAIEVLKGPQATTFGRGSLAGVISYRTKKPTKELQGKTGLSYGKDGYVEGTGSVSGPVGSGETLTFKLGARYYSYDGQYSGRNTDGSRVDDIGAEQTRRVSGALRWEPAENVDLTVRAFAAQNQDGLYSNIIFKGLNCFNNGAVARGGSYCGVIPDLPIDGIRVDLADIQRQGRPGIDMDTNLYSAEGNWGVGPGKLTGLVSWGRQDEDWIVDDFLINGPANASQVPGPTGTIANPGNITRLITLREYRSQELRFASDSDGPVQWLLGLYHYDQIISGFNGGPRYNVLAMGVPTNATVPVGTQLALSQPVSPTTVDNQAVFGSISYDPTDRLHLTLEGRYAKDTLGTDNTVQAVTGPNPLGRGTFCSAKIEEEFKSFTPRGTLRFDFDEDRAVYLNVSRGNKPGDINSSLCSSNLALTEAQRLAGVSPLGVKEERSLNYELGTKLRMLDGRMSLDVAVFWVDWTNQQVTLSQTAQNAANNNLPTNVSLTLNAGATTVKGFEINWRWKINSSWDLNAGYGYTDAKFDKFCDATYAQLFGYTTAAQSGPGCVGAASVATVSVAGFRTANAPQHTANAGAEFRRPLSDGLEFFARTDLSYQSERFAEVYNHASTGSTTRVDLRLGLEKDRWKLSLWSKNLSDNRSPDSVVRFFDPDTPNFQRAYQVRYGRGREIGATATYTF